MALIVEDGSIVANANSYSSVADFRTWAESRGKTIGADATVEAAILRAMDYFESLGFVGYKSTREQRLQWPRNRVIIDGYSVESDEIPDEVLNALYEITLGELEGDSALSATERSTISEKIGEIEIRYSEGESSKRAQPAVRFALRKLTVPTNVVSRA